MNFKKLFLGVAICALAVSSASAQVVKGVEAQTKRGPYETNRLFDNVFVGVAGGVNYYMGENDSKMDFGDRLAPAVQAYIGKWITPCVGVRVGYYGIKAKGFTYNKNNAFVQDAYQNGYEQKMNYNQLRGDFMWNISNAISGYRKDRFWDIAPYAGVGVAWAASEHKVKGSHNKNYELSISAGLYNMFRLTEALDLTVDLNAAYVNQRFDGETGGSRAEAIASASIGLAYNFCNREFSRAHVFDATPYDNKIKDLNAALESANKEKAGLNAEIANLKKTNAELAKAPKTVVNNVVVSSEVAVFFPIGKATLDATQIMNIEYIAKAVKKDSSRKITLVGSGDKATGSSATNNKLGQKRMDAVYNVLVNKFGVDKGQIVMNNLGGTDVYGKPNKLNRCVILK